jgi:CRISP-associated protein Cas1
MTLLSLASKQIWPQVLGFLHLNPRPDRLVLFHTDEEAESAGPAWRLKEFFASQRLLSEPVELVRVPHDHFGNIVEGLANTAERLELDESNCRVHLKSERLEVWRRNDTSKDEELLREIPLRDLDRLILLESVGITSAALAEVLRREVPVNIMAWNGEFLGGFLPATNAHGLARLRQYQRTLDPAFVRDMAGRIITAKIYNQRRVLQRLGASRNSDLGCMNSDLPEAPPTDATSPAPSPNSEIRNHKSQIDLALSWMDGLFASLNTSQGVDEIRGYEGAATARYFQTWATFLPDRFPFERRSTRPPLNPVNACISFGATLLYHEAVAFIHAHGLDPALGLLHNTENGRWSLALDFIEPFRPVLVEALALDLFSHQMVNAGCFEPKHSGVYLNDDGRRRFILQYERRMERQFMSECAGHRTTLRQQIENQAVMFKSALEQSEKFEPFLMN